MLDNNIKVNHERITKAVLNAEKKKEKLAIRKRVARMWTFLFWTGCDKRYVGS